MLMREAKVVEQMIATLEHHMQTMVVTLPSYLISLF